MSEDVIVLGDEIRFPDDAQIIQPARPQETNITDMSLSDKFPKWNILPPHQFINPRLKKTE